MKRSVAGAIVGVVVLGLFAYWAVGDTVTRHIRVTVQAEVAGEIVEGSAVMGFRWIPGSQGRMYIETSSEAVILDLPGRGTVYVTDAYLTANRLTNSNYWVFHLLRSFGMQANGRKSDFAKLRALHGRHEVHPIMGQPPDYPIMVAFQDETRRETMFRVKPGEFGEVFGEDVRFVGAWIEFTDDRPTAFMPARLPVALTPNESFYTAFPKRDSDGNLIAARDYAFPQKMAKSMFFNRDF